MRFVLVAVRNIPDCRVLRFAWIIFILCSVVLGFSNFASIWGVALACSSLIQFRAKYLQFSRDCATLDLHATFFEYGENVDSVYAFYV